MCTRTQTKTMTTYNQMLWLLKVNTYGKSQTVEVGKTMTDHGFMLPEWVEKDV
jgi:hypothetical protein